MEPETQRKKEEFNIPKMEDLISNPIKFVTIPYDKVINEKGEEAKSLFKEHGEFLETWRIDYLEDINWSRTSSVKFADRIIKSLLKLIDLQIRMVENYEEEKEKTREIIDSCYEVKESKMNLTPENIKNKEAIVQIENEEMNKINLLLEKLEKLTEGEGFPEVYIKQKLFSMIKDKKRDNTLNKSTIKKTYTTVFIQIKRLSVEQETKEKIIKLFGETFKSYYEAFSEYPFIPESNEIDGITFANI